ncbi:MAG: chorismate mutase [Geminicoccaceae bacterium]
MADDPKELLAEYRRSIDNLDASVVFLLAERFRLTKRIGHLKKAHDLPPGDPEREASMMERLRHLAEDADLDPAFAEQFFKFIIETVIRHHLDLRDGDKR